MPQQVCIGRLKFGDIVTCAKFAYARQSTRFSGDPLELTRKDECDDYNGRLDESRGTARFMALTSVCAGETTAFGGPDSVWTEKYLVRLDENNQPGTEVIKTSNMDLVVTLIGRATMGINPVE